MRRHDEEFTSTTLGDLATKLLEMQGYVLVSKVDEQDPNMAKKAYRAFSHLDTEENGPACAASGPRELLCARAREHEGPCCAFGTKKVLYALWLPGKWEAGYARAQR